MKRKAIFLLFLVVTLCTQAQVTTERDAISFKNQLEHRVIFYDSQKQTTSTEIMKGCNPYSRRSIQESVTFIDENNKEQTFTPDNTFLFMIKKDLFYSVSFKYKGEQKKAFLRRYLYDPKDDLAFFVYYNEADQPIYYFRRGNEGEVQALADDSATGYVSPIHTFLREKVGKNADAFEPYFAASDITPTHLQGLLKAVHMGNVNRIPKFRWGITANVGLYDLENKEYEFDKKVIGAGGLFADIPLIDCLSLHPELTFTTYGYKGQVSFNKERSSAVYNGTEVMVPIMFRYTFKYIPGNVLPYVQVGYQPSFLLNNKLEYRYLSEGLQYEGDYSYYTKLYEGQDDTKKFTSALTAGVGIEYIFKNNHRVYLDVRGAFSPVKFGRTGFAFSLSYNL